MNQIHIAYIKKKQRLMRLKIVVFFSVLFFLGWSIGFDSIKLLKGIPRMNDLVFRLLSPDLAYAKKILPILLETIEIALLSTFTGLFFAVPAAIVVSNNMMLPKFVIHFFNAVFAWLRTIPSLVWASVLVTVFSIGKFSGILALTIIAFLMAVKLLKEFIESIPKENMDAVRIVGADETKVLQYAVLPYMLPMSISIFFLILETNLRSASVLGLVGAGGIGQILWRDLNHLRYNRVSTIILVLFILIFLIDKLSFKIRAMTKKTFFKPKTIIQYKLKKHISKTVLVLSMLLLLYLILSDFRMTDEQLSMGLTHIKKMAGRIIRFDFSYTSRLLKGMLESFFIACFATLTGGIFSLVISGFGVMNIIQKKISVFIIKVITNILRTFPAIITAIIFFRGVGPGAFAGSLALSLYTTGVLTKMYSEYLENLPEEFLESAFITGARPIQVYIKSIIPQTFPAFLSLLLYRMESNIRNATVLGVIGAGGVGTLLTMNINWRNWERVGFLIFGISLMIIIIDNVSAYLRRHIT